MYERKTSHLNTHRRTTASTTKSPTPIKQGTQQRTGRAPLTSVTNQQQLTDEQTQTQRRIAARAATAMDQIRRRQPRSYMLWGDNRKAVIKRYPDGAQEIMVPQTLTSEQEQYEFPPRSRLLKKLATSRAERHRLSSLQHDITTPPTVLPPLHSSSFSYQAEPIVMTNMTRFHRTSGMELDQGALAEWFSGKQQKRNRHVAKEKAVMDWMTDVERSTSLMKKSDQSSIKNYLLSNDSKSFSTNQTTQYMHDINIHFKSKTGKLMASGVCCQKSVNYLSAPDEDTKKHYVRLQRLLKYSNKPWKMATTITAAAAAAAETTQTARYKPYISASSSLTTTTPTRSDRHYLQIPRPTLSSASPNLSMVQLAQMFHKTLQDQQARAHKRMQQLEVLLEEERHKRQDIQRTQQKTMSQLDTLMKQYQEQRRIPPSPILSTTTTTSSSSSPSPASPAWASNLSPQSFSSSLSRKNGKQVLEGWVERISWLETRMQNETKSRLALQQTVVSTAQCMDGLKDSLSTHALEHSSMQRQLEKQINDAFNRLSILAQQRHG